MSFNKRRVSFLVIIPGAEWHFLLESLFIPADAQRFVCLWGRQRIGHSLDCNYYLFVFVSTR